MFKPNVHSCLVINSGDIMVTDNRRVMHGRLSYKSDQQRKLEGWYTGWDSMLSQLRVQKIKRKQQQQQ